MYHWARMRALLQGEFENLLCDIAGAIECFLLFEVDKFLNHWKLLRATGANGNLHIGIDDAWSDGVGPQASFSFFKLGTLG